MDRNEDVQPIEESIINKDLDYCIITIEKNTAENCDKFKARAKSKLSAE